jgi:hypothetical protein
MVSSQATLYPRQVTLGTHCTENWVGLTDGLDTEARGRAFAFASDRTPVVQSVLRHYTDWATPHYFLS